MRRLPSPALLTAFIVILVLMAIGHLTDMSKESRLTAELLNAGHVLIMGLFALVCLALAGSLLKQSLPKRNHHYLAAFVLTVVVGILWEAAQIVSPRNADVYDVLRDAIGAVTFLAFYIRFDPSLSEARKRWGFITRTTLLVGPPLIVIVTMLPAAAWAGAFYYRSHQVPYLATFDSSWERLFWTTANATLEITPPPDDWSESDGTMVGRMFCQPTPRSGFAINHVYPDWSNYDFLQLQLYFDDRAPGLFYVQVEDAEFQGTVADRYTFQSEISPGHNLIEVPLDSAGQLPSGRPLDLGQIKIVYFFTADTTRTYQIYIDNIRLR